MEPSDDFLFPFPPYKIQADFMKNLYNCLESGKLGIFESPTGTGKTLSIICGALKWLKDHEEREKNLIVNKKDELDTRIKEIEAENSNDWFSVQTEKVELVSEKQSLQNKIDAMNKQEQKILKYKEKVKEYRSKKKIEKHYLQNENWKNKDSSKKESNLEKDFQISKEESIDVDLILNDVDDQSDDSEEDEEIKENNFSNCKIFFCSRTHSQLSQFIGELNKSPYSDQVSLVPLASRNSYCINSTVKLLKNISLINEQCQQLQKKKAAPKDEEGKIIKKQKSTSCPYMPGNQPLLMAEILTSVCDIEDIIKKSQEIKTCPYYSTRKSVEDGQVILVPYNSILHKSTRDSLGINLKNNILIVDEAHNLLEAIERMHSVTITGRNVLHCFNQLSQYQKRFENVLTAKNILLLSQLSFCLKKFIKVLGGNSKSHPDDKVSKAPPSKLYSIEDFETMAEIDTVNIFDLINFIQKSKLMHKLRGYVEKYQDDLVIKKPVENKKGVTAFLESLQKKNTEEIPKKPVVVPVEPEKEQTTSPLIIINSFLETLKTNCTDGRILVNPGDTIGQGLIKFLLLNPAAHFSDIIQDARAVVLAGGTMEPISEFKDQLFISAGAEPDRIVTFSCDHVVPKENIQTCILKSGPTNVEFEFNFQNRQNTKLLDELGRTLINICNIVPAGIVVFLPSYGYEEILFKHLESTGVLTKIRTKKLIFREPKLTTKVNQVLEEYAASVHKPVKPQNGAILFSVVGGKLSEGLNFSDDLGRCVIVVGMPYPNIKSAELQEKMKYLNENVGPTAGSIFYENACMKAVNQCIGRAVRHIADYSTVVLLDRRYANKTKSLPGWIQRTLTVQQNFGGCVQVLARFFAARRRPK